MGKLFSFESMRTPQYDPGQVYASRQHLSKVAEPESWDQVILEPLKNMGNEILKFFPDLIIALITLAIGWLIAKIAEFIFGKFLKSIGFNRFAENIGIAEFLQGEDNKIQPHQWFGKLLFWMIMFFTIITSLGHLNLYFASSKLDSFFYFIITIFSTLIVFIVGLFLSFISGKVVQTISQKINVPKPDLYAGITRWTILVFTFLICLMQIGLPPEVILIILGVAYLTLCITFVIAFGTGGIAWASQVLEKTLKKKD